MLPLEDEPKGKPEMEHLSFFPAIVDVEKTVKKAGFKVMYSNMSKEVGLMAKSTEVIVVGKNV